MMRAPIHIRRTTGARKVPLPTERQIQETCSSFLELDGWRRLRTDPVSDRSRGKGFGELGMADDLYIRYTIPWVDAAPCGSDVAFTETMWIEWKRERGGQGKRALFTKAEKAKIHQKAWHAAERARGALTVIMGEDCPASIEGFQEWYRNSGLMRRKLLTAALRQREATAN